MIDSQAIDEILDQFEGWNSQKIVVALKSLEGKMFIDVRKWIDIKGEMRPSKGLMLSVNHWPKAIKMIETIISRHVDIIPQQTLMDVTK